MLGVFALGRGPIGLTGLGLEAGSLGRWLADDYVRITCMACMIGRLRCTSHDRRNHNGNALAGNGCFTIFSFCSGETTSSTTSIYTENLTADCNSSHFQ